MGVETPLMASGLDSIAIGELANALSQKIYAELPPTMLFDHPTIGAVAGFIAATVAEAKTSSAKESGSLVTCPRSCVSSATVAAVQAAMPFLK